MSGEHDWKGYQETVSIPIPRPTDEVFAYPPDKRHRWQHYATTPKGDHKFRCRSCGKTWVVQSIVNLIAWKMRTAQASLTQHVGEQVLGPNLRTPQSPNPQPPRPR